ncbi:methyltransferase domain-containing protein [Methanofollis formosanus]|uniref:Methyltransferase domain-containing protein n=1 Tax=Methanofollis formosanus TaxID=299308 RepID=A0A8G0ZYK7_9EURY|nr:methyltransferase domain-containing protein [Methanofollis formosanus]QYZ78095.1 methyltransferase domain-containing protein [Methanofollis formosanus]
MGMPTIARIRLSLGMVQIAMNMLGEVDRGRKSPLSPAATEILYSAYFSRICMGDVAGMLGVSRSTATDHINHLEKEGYVRRVRSPDDRRAYYIAPTRKGEEWLLAIEGRLFAYLEEGMAQLTGEEQQEFARLCAKFTGVHDETSFSGVLQDLKRSRDRLHVPMTVVKEGRLLRLEEVADARYHADEEEQVKQMFEERIPETDDGIQDEMIVEFYEEMQKNLRDAGHLPLGGLLESGIRAGTALEIGPGPGYLGLEWLKATEETRLVGLEISQAMIASAEKNAAGYGLTARVRYQEGNALAMPFEDGVFDAVFSNGSLHEWESPERVFDEISRVLKVGGRFCITDLRRDLSPGIYRQMYDSCEPPEIRPGFESSVRAAYTREEIMDLLGRSHLTGWQVIAHPFGLVIHGKKA